LMQHTFCGEICILHIPQGVCFLMGRNWRE
jgi:hypothetical protein